jgi:hypothetical protein
MLIAGLGTQDEPRLISHAELESRWVGRFVDAGVGKHCVKRKVLRVALCICFGGNVGIRFRAKSGKAGLEHVHAEASDVGELGDHAGERVEHLNGVGGLVTEDEEAIGQAEVVASGKC